MVLSALISMVVFPVVGKLCDVHPPNITIPFAFILRGISTILFCNLKAPNTVSAYFVCVMMIVGTIVEMISVDTIFYKQLAKESRGVLCGLYSCAGQVGILIFSIIGGWLFDKVGPNSPFIIIGVLDFTFALITIISVKVWNILS